MITTDKEKAIAMRTRKPKSVGAIELK